MLVIPEAFDQNNAEQMSALQCLEQTSMSLFLTGSAGTGKSYFLQHYCEVTHKKFVKLAPTGLAALNIHGQTIHSFFRLPLAPLTDPNHTSAITRRYRKDKRELIRQLDLIIIDEISMVRCDLLDAMDRFHPPRRQPIRRRCSALILRATAFTSSRRTPTLHWRLSP